VVLAAAIVVIARYLPFLSVVMSLVGAFMTIFISIILPAAASYKMHSQEMSTVEKMWDIFVMLLGTCCAISGTAAALLALSAKLSMT
jgi:hypothetical protein